MNFSDERESSRQDDRLLHEVDFYAELVDRHPVLDVAVEAIRLLHQQRSAPRVFRAQEVDHLAE
jgi:hypothetical protein